VKYHERNYDNKFHKNVSHLYPLKKKYIDHLIHHQVFLVLVQLNLKERERQEEKEIQVEKWKLRERNYQENKIVGYLEISLISVKHLQDNAIKLLFLEKAKKKRNVSQTAT
jgi:hypothetical protein